MSSLSKFQKKSPVKNIVPYGKQEELNSIVEKVRQSKKGEEATPPQPQKYIEIEINLPAA